MVAETECSEIERKVNIAIEEKNLERNENFNLMLVI